MKIETLEPLSPGRDRVKVLFIAGPTRSGSTIISNILGQISGFFHAGEVIEAWDRGRTWKCSCGQFPSDCDVWSKIFKTLNAVISAKDQATIIRLRDRLSRSHRVIFNHYLRSDNYNEKKKTIYANGLAKLYSIIRSHTKADIIVDSSKNVGYGDTLSKVENIDLHVVHLVRDSRATAFSWSKKKKELWKENSLRSSLEWTSRNIASEVMKKKLSEKYINIRYEDFIATPQEVVRAILKILNIKKKIALPFVSDHEVIIKSSHGLCGNPGRYSIGVEELAMDNRWKTMKKTDGLVATLSTWPLLLKYRYRLHLS